MKTRFTTVAILAVAMIHGLLGCGPGGRSTACSAEGEMGCRGTQVVLCEPDEWDRYSWQPAYDCAQVGKTCVDEEPFPHCEEREEACPDVSGSWTFTEHCSAGLVGQTYSVYQDGCLLDVGGIGWSGTVNFGGSLDLSGPAGGEMLSCRGTLSGQVLSAACSPGTCRVAMSRTSP